MVGRVSCVRNIIGNICDRVLDDVGMSAIRHGIYPSFQGGFGVEGSVWAAVGRMGEAYTVCHDTVHILDTAEITKFENPLNARNDARPTRLNQCN